MRTTGIKKRPPKSRLLAMRQRLAAAISDAIKRDAGVELLFLSIKRAMRRTEK